MDTDKPTEQTLRRLEHRLIELSAWRNRFGLPLEGRFQAAGSKPGVLVREGDPWPGRSLPVQIKFRAQVPKAWAGLPVSVRLWLGGEAKLSANGKLIGGLNPYHKEYPLLEKARGNETFELELEAVPKGLFGTPNLSPRIEEARLVVPDLPVRAFHEDLAAALDAAKYLATHSRPEIAALIAEAIEAALVGLELPRSPTANYLARIVQAPEAAAVQASIWDEWRFEAEPVQLPEAVRIGLPARRQALRAALEALKSRYPAEGQLWLTGHAHIDLAWLWPFSETRRKVQRTFGTMLTLMERYPWFHFNQSSAQAYAFVEEDDPELFQRIQARVKEGRWDVVGGMWVEPDGNLLSGESWARQLLYGQRYFQQRFGRRAKVCWLPDTFGYTANLPQMLQQGGIPYFFTTKLNWNETNPFPYDLYQWEGLDGSRVIAHSFLNPNQGYNGNVLAYDLGETWRNFKGKRYHDTSLFSIGWGDGGGGPTFEMLERFERLQDFPGLPRLEMGRVEAFYQQVEQRVQTADLPVWVGEQYLELHRGTYTTQSQTKWLHRRLEHTLVEAEAASTLAHILQGAAYPQAELYAAWTTLLKHHFHDVLPGSSVHQVYQEAVRDLGATLEAAQALRHTALERLSTSVGVEGPTKAKVVVWNLTLEDRPLRLRLPRPAKGAFRLLAPGGVEVAYQEQDGEILLASEDLQVPGLGYLALAVVAGTPAKVPSDLEASSRTLENRYLRVRVGADGTLESVYDKAAGREVLAGPGNQLWAYTDIPREWDAWEVDAAYAKDGQELKATQPPRLVRKGLLEASIAVERGMEGVRVTQEYRLRAGSRRLEVHTHLRWERRRTLLRAYFPLALRAHEAWFETAYGAVARPTHTNTSWDAARFEVSAHRWASLDEAGYGVSLLNDGKYGHSARGHTLGLTLLRSPVYPDPYAEEGEHHFTYALFPHIGDWRGETLLEAQDLNAPLQALTLPAQGGDWPARRKLLRVDPPGLRLSALKKQEEGRGVVLRVYEALGGRGSAQLFAEWEVQAAHTVNFLEERQGSLKPKGGQAVFTYTPYQVVSLELKQ
ncbi:alpha-mannosidase [Meiothermus granaticius]|uniref:Mannosylglycerate hydrolase n=1 Tax=Meiothermus granaticius NBRC 107808 TaxID=1227551 RepID=A0A399F6T3_9DEIN|nr:glycoside hydrolase family 38 C-terminal domain-containing protein [Meiothermus granaticius]RIH91820.1 Mannosylglycerate hydrolase [Meiothermus granaticius NBRC 107808]GEM85667.1 alpha-mannosidase [Meiothermus granaticius NBRC 107808]